MNPSISAAAPDNALSETVFYVDPWLAEPEAAHALTLHHEPAPRRLAWLFRVFQFPGILYD